MVTGIGVVVVVVVFLVGMAVRSRRRRQQRNLDTLLARQQAKNDVESESNHRQAHNPEIQQYMDGVNSPRNRPF